MRDISRRDFLKYLGIGAVGLAARPRLLGALDRVAGDRALASEVVQCYDDNATTGSTVNEPVVQMMVDESIKTLAGINEVGPAWQSVFPGITLSSVVAIKVNVVNSQQPTHIEVANSIVNGLASMDFSGTPFRRNNIIIYEILDYVLPAAGYTIYDGSDPDTPRCFGNNHSGIGYDYDKPLSVNGLTSYASKVVTQMCDYLVNLSVLRTHGTSTVTMALKNHYGTINNASSCHGSACNPYIPAVNSELRDRLSPQSKQKLCIVDGLFGMYSGGPGGSPNFNPKLLLMSRDPVGIDFQGQNVINVERQRHGLTQLNAAHILTAAQPPYSLGSTDIRVIEVNNPSGVSERGRAGGGGTGLTVAPQPVTGGSAVRFTLARPSAVRAVLVDQSGRVVSPVFSGSYGHGRHSVAWPAGVPAGSYFLKLETRFGTQACKVVVAG